MTSQDTSLITTNPTLAGNADDTMPASVRSLIRGRIGISQAAITLIAMLSLGLGLFRIERLGTANSYYAAAVQSMMQSWHAFLFVSFDRLGFVSIDKPPLGLWDQALLADLFGFHGWVVILPQVLALTGSVVLLYHLVRRTFGELAGLIAALCLALTPISVAAARNNTSDSMLVFVLLLATWAVMTAISRESVRWFVLGMALIGIGFNVKMMEAWLVLPALVAAWTLSPSERTLRHRIRNRFAGLVTGGITCLVVSFSWMTFVQLTPASQRPWVDSTATNNVFSLAFGYNGLSRLLPSGWSIFGMHNSGSSGPVNDVLSGGSWEAGTQGPFRLLSPQLGAQIGWLVPAALISLIVAWGIRRWWTVDARRTSLMIWGGWLITVGGFFSVAGFFHRYYLVMLAPAIAALVGIGIATCWNARPRALFLLPVMAGVTIGIQIHLLNRFPIWQGRLTPWMIAIGSLVALAVLAMRFVRKGPFSTPWFAGAACGLAILSLLAAPATWSILTSVDAGTGIPNPSAGPTSATSTRAASHLNEIISNATVAHKVPGSATPSEDQVTSWLQHHWQNTGHNYLVAVRWAHDGWGFILSTGDPVMALGGFTGRDPIMNPSSFAQAVASGEVRYAYGNYGASLKHGQTPHSVNEWVASTCSVVPANTVDPNADSKTVSWGAMKLYDCSRTATPPASSAPTPSPASNSTQSHIPTGDASALLSDRLRITTMSTATPHVHSEYPV